jgi:Na+-transporting methylmalonyl-CoA/oxaloacetate decarboxylase gamma subunit
MRHVFLVLSIVVLAMGAYLKLFYDVPDGQETINFFVSGVLLIVGVSSLLVNVFWKTPRTAPRDSE